MTCRLNRVYCCIIAIYEKVVVLKCSSIIFFYPCRLVKYCTTYHGHDPFLSKCLPSNPWLTDDPTYWTLNMPK